MRGDIRRWLLLTAALVVLAGALASSATAVTLPDNRAYELVMRYEKDGHEVDLNGVLGGYGYASRDGNAMDWQAIGGCCDAESASQETYQSYRGANGWQTKSLKPPGESSGIAGLFGEGAMPVFWTPDLQRTIFRLPKTYPPGSIHPNGQSDLYLRGPNGDLTLVSQGPAGSGDEERGAVFGGATPDGDRVVFSSPEALTSDATGLEFPGQFQYLYLRDVSAGTTTLVDVDQSGTLLGARGAALGDAGYLFGGLIPANNWGTSTNAISRDGSKVFFEAPLPETTGATLDRGESHLYMRNLPAATTTAIDDPGSEGWARYEGASEDGSLVFFTSNEGLAGAPAVPELYAFNTTGAAIGPVPSMSALPISLGEDAVRPTTSLTAEALPGEETLAVASTAGFGAGRGVTIEGEALTVKEVPGPNQLVLTQALANPHPEGATVTEPAAAVLGMTAIANDGSRAFFVSDDVLADNQTAGSGAVEGEPNLYLYDVRSGATTFVATLGPLDVNTCEPSCGSGRASMLVGEPDLSRRAFPTPDGSALAFESGGDLTGDDQALQTRLTAPVMPGEHTLQVESTAGMSPKQFILLGSGAGAEQEKIEAIDSATELTVSEYDERSNYGVVGEFAAGEPVARLDIEVYRYLAGGGLACLSCAGPATSPVGMAFLGASSGGSYGPPGQNVPMSEDASIVFFQSANSLVPGAQAARPGHEAESMNVYEWRGGQVSLISDGSPSGSVLDGTTPSGNDVFISTRSQLTSGETGNWINVYDARVGGGFPEPPGEPAPCVGQGCRASGGATPFFEVPASSLGAREEGGAAEGGSFEVAPLSAAQRGRLARSGRLTLRVTATAPGMLIAEMRAKIDGKDVRVAQAATSLDEPGTAKLHLLISEAARRALAQQRSLALQLAVTFSGSPTAATANLKLHAAGAPRKGRHG